MEPWDRLDDYLVYASTALGVMGAVALALFIVFRLRFRELKNVSRNSEANVFNKTFVVFDPYQQTTIFHRFLALLPFVPLIGGLGMAALLFVIIDSGLLLTLLAVIMALGLMVVEESPEAYTQSNILIKAIQGGSSFGVGDMRLLQVTERLLPRLSNYYLGLSIFFIALASVLPYVWSSVLWYFAMFFGYMLQASVTAGLASWVGALFLYVVTVTVFIVLATMAKSRLFEHYTETSAV